MKTNEVFGQNNVCQRLRKEKAPPAPVLSGLTACSDAVRVEWLAAPVQDLRAFHVYRSDREDDPPVFVGCILRDGTPFPGRWPGIVPGCEDIPAEAGTEAVHGTLLDANVEPNRVYWYRVSAVDWLGNESASNDLRQLPASSTFTYSSDLPAVPVLLPQVTGAREGCGLATNWTPSFDPAIVQGFVVFRATSAGGPYRQISPIVTGNTFNDKSARRGVSYWYRVQAINHAGKLSAPSYPVQYQY